MRTAEGRVAQNCGGPAGAFCAWAGRKARVFGPNARRCSRHDEPSFQMGASRWGEVSRYGSYRNRGVRASGVANSLRTSGEELADKLSTTRPSQKTDLDFPVGDVSAGSSVPFRLRQSERARRFAGSFWSLAVG